MNKTVFIGGEEYKVLEYADNPRSGYQGVIYQRVDTGEIVVAHRGSEPDREFGKDWLQTNSGMIFARVNLQAADAIKLTRHALKYANDPRNIARYGHPSEVTVTGHSLGGCLTQITAHAFDLRGETFNAYGAASLGYHIPEGGERVINHVMATDVVSAASPHYGRMRTYAVQQDITRLQSSGRYDNNDNRLLDWRHPLPVAGGSFGAHDMHWFLPVDGQGHPDRSVLHEARAQQLADRYEPMIEKFRDDVRAIRSGLTLTGEGVGLLCATGCCGRRSARSSASARPCNPTCRRASRPGATPRANAARPTTCAIPTTRPMAGTGRPIAAWWRIDHGLGRTPDGASERLAASLTAAGAGLSSIGQVVLSGDGSRAFAVEGGQGPAEVRRRVQVDVAEAVQRTVEASTQDWQAVSDRLAREQQEQQAREQTQSAARGAALT